MGEAKVQRGAKDTRNFRGHGDATAGQSQHEEAFASGEVGKDGSELASGVCAIWKGHGARQYFRQDDTRAAQLCAKVFSYRKK